MGPQVLSYKVASTLSSQRIVAITAAGTVGYPTTSTTMPIGVTVDTVRDTNQAIPVARDNEAKLYFNDTCAAGGLVASDTSGRGIPFSAPNTTTAMTVTGIVGVLVDDAVSATATVAKVLINPFLAR